ncbi:MAG TPA: flagellar basal-body MS-ring/collar protein FliF [Nevskiaceae bacterium]|nr:flagellar basal-body MS-ring/collar protein FliF [Nevskiaceae bacterium]
MSTATLPAALKPFAALLRPLLLLAGIAGAVAAGLLIGQWADRPGQQPLLGLGEGEVSTALAQLGAAGIPAELDTAGRLMVPAERLAEARLQLAAAGLPRSAPGMEMIQQDQGFGASQFIESARYQHALEAELARSVASLSPVKQARVHLALARPSAFTRDTPPASASVIVELHPGRVLESGQAASIVQLVAASVPGLTREAVTVVDQSGRLLSEELGDESLLRSRNQYELARRLEADYSRRIEQLLLPLTGAGRVRSQVAVDLDFAETEEAREEYANPDGALRSEQLSEEPMGAGAGSAVGGVPGATSNQPAETQPALALNQEAGSGGETPARRNRSRAFELDRTLRHTREPGGRIERITIAVLVDHLPRSDAEGKTVMQAPDAESLAAYEALVREAVGFDAERGDRVTVRSAPFLAPPALEPETVEWWQQPQIQQGSRLGVAFLLLMMLILAVLRPLTRQLLTPAPALATAGGGPALADLSPERLLAEDALRLASAHRAGAVEEQPDAPPSVYDTRLQQARSAVGQDPKRVAQLVKQWMNDEP